VYHYDYPRPAVTVDIVLFSRVKGDFSPYASHYRTFQVLLIKRGKEPFKDCWALPGGFVDADEDLIDAAKRELLEETGVDSDDLKQVGAVGTPGRDPRGHTISIVFSAFEYEAPTVKAGDDAVDFKWVAMDVLHKEQLAFDHLDVIQMAFEALPE
jgi:8-oxo-dGTP diphosphatase